MKEKENFEEISEYEEYEMVYRNLKEQEAPDLWSRIEAELDKENILHLEPSSNTKDRKQEKVLMRKKILAFSTMAAAVFFVLVAIPIVSQFDFFKANGVESEQMLENASESLADNTTEEQTNSESSRGNTNSIDGSIIASENDAQWEEAEDSIKESSTQQNLQNSVIEDSVQIVLDIKVNRADFVALEFEDLKESTQKVIKKEIKNYKKYKYYLDQENQNLYMEYNEEIYEICGGELR